MSPRKPSRGLLIVITVIFALLLIEGLLVAFVFVSPDAEDKLGGFAASVQRVWDGTEGTPGIRTRVATAFHRGYVDWVVPLWREPQMAQGEPEFTACVECHPDYAKQRKFSVYMDHPLHAQLGVACETCHPQNAHPNPPHPLEKTCAECHDEVHQKDSCSYCHPPASLPHFYLLGSPRQSVVECDVCHPKGSFDAGTPTAKVHMENFDGQDAGECLSCHERAGCESCHGTPHPSDWASTHGDSLLADSVAACYACHVGTWCSDRCHAVTPGSSIPPRPIPSVGVRPS